LRYVRDEGPFGGDGIAGWGEAIASWKEDAYAGDRVCRFRREPPARRVGGHARERLGIGTRDAANDHQFDSHNQPPYGDRCRSGGRP
jgi:hypothetical protein